MGLFDFIQDIGNHAERAIDTYAKDDLFVDTCHISDGHKPFETAVAHPAYNDGELIIVELYDTPEDAQTGHNKWVDTMLHHPPNQLTDVSTADLAILLRAIGGLPPFERGSESVSGNS